ncbi:MAG TPA: diguanylate cyclase, partial [Pseudomonadales bacterium]|nr:diguanylate cyclase [Pseudomonadales bacterium]
MNVSRQTGAFALLLRLLDWFIPLIVRTDKVQRTRAYILVGIVLLNLCVCALMAVMLLTTSLSALGMRAGIGVVVVSATIYLIALGVFNRRHSLVEAGNIAVFAIYIAVLVGILITGGYGHSPFMALWIVVPVFVFPMAGARSGIVWTVIVFLTINCLMLAKKWGFTAWQLSDSATLQLLENALPIVLCFMVVSALVIYERVNLTLYRWLEEERIRFAFKASHDSLTDLPNREEFYTRLDTALREAAQKKAQFALVYVDLDNFKPINDQFGHFAGDKVLKVTAQRLREVLRNTDLASRIGGDEFALILHGIQKRSDIDLAMNKMLYTLAIPIDV